MAGGDGDDFEALFQAELQRQQQQRSGVSGGPPSRPAPAPRETSSNSCSSSSASRGSGSSSGGGGGSNSPVPPLSRRPPRVMAASVVLSTVTETGAQNNDGAQPQPLHARGDVVDKEGGRGDFEWELRAGGGKGLGMEGESEKGGNHREGEGKHGGGVRAKGERPRLFSEDTLQVGASKRPTEFLLA